MQPRHSRMPELFPHLPALLALASLVAGCHDTPPQEQSTRTKPTAETLAGMKGKKLDAVIAEFGLPDGIYPRSNYQIRWSGPDATVALTYLAYQRHVFVGGDGTVVAVYPIKDLTPEGQSAVDPPPLPPTTASIPHRKEPVPLDLKNIEDETGFSAVVVATRAQNGKLTVTQSYGYRGLVERLETVVGNGSLDFAVKDEDIQGVLAIANERGPLASSGQLGEMRIIPIVRGVVELETCPGTYYAFDISKDLRRAEEAGATSK